MATRHQPTMCPSLHPTTTRSTRADVNNDESFSSLASQVSYVKQTEAEAFIFIAPAHSVFIKRLSAAVMDLYALYGMTAKPGGLF